MADWYDLPSNFSTNGGSSYTQVSGIGSIFQYMEYVLNGYFGEIILGSIFLMSFMGSMAMGSRKALLSSSFICFVLGIYLTRIDLIHPALIFLTIIGMIVGAIFAKEDSGGL